VPNNKTPPKFNMKTRENTLDKYVIGEMTQYTNRITLEKKDNWLDAGANIGAFANIIADKVNKVICYEPDTDNFELLKENTLNYQNVVCEQKALVNNSDISRDFFLNIKKNKGAHSFLVKRGRDKVSVNCQNINEVITKYKINKIKMDVEGAEEELLSNLNFKNINELIMEYHFVTLKDMNHEKYFKLIEKLKTKFKEVVYKDKINKNWTTLIYCKN